MKTKTEKLKNFINNNEWDKAFALAKTFRIWDNKEDKEIVTIAHELNHNEKFYTSLGYDKFMIQDKAKYILERIYGRQES